MFHYPITRYWAGQQERWDLSNCDWGEAEWEGKGIKSHRVEKPFLYDFSF